ncbi:hypothetical protein JQX08_15500 [Pseudomonas sp. UL073]|uniref:Uncharacterized protein n=1 Tax=Zestomonas insulae TaxID=2809017 RepID=A0ABS2IIH3_9GAMM|nr:hypothetical protein [Pseudomonas insulae]MBM7062114.1 hypothetical protein [Pseudomonas insulae]
MTTPRQPGLDPELEQHYRRHSLDVPSAALDARILAAARAACPPAPLSRLQRLKRWLAAGGAQPRWSLALAGFACLGIGLSLTWRSIEQAPVAYDAPAPAVMSAPTPPAKMAAAPAPLAEEAKRSASASATFAREQAESAPLADALPAERVAKAKAAAASEPQASLRRLQELQRSGQADAAQRLREQLRRDFPQLDIDAELQRLNAAP